MSFWSIECRLMSKNNYDNYFSMGLQHNKMWKSESVWILSECTVYSLFSQFVLRVPIIELNWILEPTVNLKIKDFMVLLTWLPGQCEDQAKYT